MADIKLQDALEEIYELNPIEYRWKKYEKEAPELTDDFKWNFLSEIKQPQHEISGPSVGSLLYALNPQTSELGLKQMESELNQELKANEMFDKRGEDALKFMENRVQEDIDKKKLQNVEAGHFNSLMSNYSQALQDDDGRQIAVLEDQIMRTVPNAKQFIEQGREMARKGIEQRNNFYELISKIPTGTLWRNDKERENFIKEVSGYNLNEKQKSDLISKARSVNDKINYAKMQSFNAGVANNVNRNINMKNATDKENWMKENRHRFRSQKAADEEYARLYGGK